MSWAARTWHIVEAKAATLGVLRPGGPASLLDLDGRFLLAFLEGLLRDSPDHEKALDRLYAAARPIRDTAESRDARAAEIQRLTRLFGG